MCKSLELINQGGEIRVSSRVIAMDFEKEHKNIKRDIQNLISSNLSVSKMFIINEYKDSMNRNQQEYFINRDGFSLLVMGFTGQKALEWKLKYINAFNEMEKRLNKLPKLSKELQAIFTLDQKQEELKEEINTVKCEIKEMKDYATLSAAQCEFINRKYKSKIVKILGGKDSMAYKNRSLRAKVYADFQKQLKKEFVVPTYKHVLVKDLDKLIKFIDKYETQDYLNMSIIGYNNQLKFSNNNIITL
ncbi:Rha family transcriptional regulator [Clostridium brassicae]|uniref:ORF6C domain-containing protein n=1 Tax=Clostridium brassicae TaxID=2999072 RepID=A0ABT4D6G6_9CLOT|nr:Rha family transcriptional regulator [Clostridium brassicae]MCY6957896.1 ORF6C domain-containing protein [Clostridium brassicae]